MGDTNLAWVFELYDKVSRPAAGMAGKVGMAEKAMIASAAATAKLVQQLDRAGPAAEGAAQGHASFLSRLHDIVEIAYQAPRIIGALWDKAREFASHALGEMRFKQDSLLALEAMRGTRAAAIEIFQGVEDFAWKTGQGIQDVMRVTKDLLSSGVSPENVEALRLLLADMRVVDAGKAEQVATIIGEIGRRGEMTSRHMLALSNAGIDARLMWEGLARETGYSATALKKMEGLSIRTGTALKVIYGVGAQKFSGGVVGSLAEREAKTLPVLLDRVREIPGKILDELTGFELGAGGGAAERILGNLLEAFDPSGPTGRRIIASVRGLVDYIGEALGLKGAGGLFAELAGPNGPKRIEAIFRSTIDWLKTTAIPAVQAFAASLGTIAEAVMKVARVVNLVSGGEAPWLTQEELANPSKRTVEMARATLADPNASQASREFATKILHRVANPPGQAVPPAPPGTAAPSVGGPTAEDILGAARAAASRDHAAEVLGRVASPPTPALAAAQPPTAPAPPRASAINIDDILGTAYPQETRAVKEHLAKIANQQVSVTVNVAGNATKEDAERIGRAAAEGTANALEQHAIQAGGM